MFEKIKGLVTQLLFGIDTANGIGSVAILGLLFGVQESFFVKVGYLLFAGFCAYLPDLDLLIYYPLRERFKLTDHWVIGHYPLFVIPCAGLLVFYGATWLGLNHVAFLTTLAVVCVAVHFIHDSVEAIGFPWLAPFDWTHFSLGGGRLRFVERSEFKRFVAKQVEAVEGGTLVDRLDAFSEPVTPAQIAIWAIAVIMFGLWVLF